MPPFVSIYKRKRMLRRGEKKDAVRSKQVARKRGLLTGKYVSKDPQRNQVKALEVRRSQSRVLALDFFRLGIEKNINYFEDYS